jgi:predicted nucleotidyltransferase
VATSFFKKSAVGQNSPDLEVFKPRRFNISAVADLFCVSEYIRMDLAELPIPIDREEIAHFCQKRGIRKLSLFGSVLRRDFDSRRSDVDVLAEFEPGVLKSVGFQYSDMARNWRPSSGEGWIFVRDCIR